MFTSSTYSRCNRGSVSRTARAVSSSASGECSPALKALRADWGGDYDDNVSYANAAARDLFGDDIDGARQLVTKTDKLVLDTPEMLRVFAKLGREMAEDGTMGTPMNETAIDGINDQIRGFEDKIQEAKNKGDVSRANELYQQQSALYDKLYGTQGVVGAEGRVL